ncbi:MAG: double-strand break repair helicase AddA [Cypionkella sp.]|uniref:double-strand break repair helicase AddA n=1 Tax=Cypionkella sp. TaxID=2811411 RepID=UPI002ABCA517|nr:double-strand break repair helicase AddA [Cypionkella sp.]MDZ4312252.1 double-strand break repair helicase AddA [Cypionkella sp.]
MTRNDASERQVQASNPADTVWLSANAGSGKTRVLTDRVARLLLRGVEPQHILCLTYTKAAATEMQNRLFRRLGEWAMKPDADLHRALADLGDDTRHAPGALAKARQLFARAIETPGGLRIQTIHSFCATLLRRFPLEAGVSPQFTELDDRAARLLRENIIEEMAEFRAPEVMAEVARAYTGEDFTALMEQVSAKRAGFTKPLTEAQSRDLFNVPNEETTQTLLNDVLLGIESDLIANILPALQSGGPTDSKTAAKLAALDLTDPSLVTLSALENTLLYGGTAKSPYGAKIGALPTKPTQKLIGNHLPQLDALMLRTESARPRRIALQAAQKTAVLHRFAAAFLPLYESAKSARGFLDFDDLITRAKALLTDPSVAAWVLFRLDGGIDHILVDEAQDTSPDQWRVIELLSAEFTAGLGTRDETRTLFVVGDKKQSIYSFQGADVAAFDEKQNDFQAKFHAAQKNFVRLDLEYSFRSSTAILRVVDETFADRFPTAMGDNVHHLAFKSDLPGRVDLWPLLEKSEDPKDENWEDPVDLISETHHTARLAEKIANHIKTLIAAGTQIPTDDGPRSLHAGDVLILVQRRSALFSEIIRACKKANLPIAGADRLKLGAELAVKDLAALLSFLSTPEDDLSLAALLRSPLCGWTEAELYTLAQPRKGFLWETLRDTTTHPETLSMLHDLRNNADFLRPYDLIERALTRHDGRRRLLTRLGPEAEDGIDEFLSQALAFERSEIPSLTGFLIWLETDDIEVKRQMDSEGHRIRVMTVHGAKGLEAPLVILPDTCDRTPQDRDEIYALDNGIPVWKTPSDESPAQIATARALRKDKGEEESLRLLYVALTRARTWLIVCGAGEAKKDGAWYKLVQQGIQAAGCVAIADGALRHSFGNWPDPVTKQSLTQPKTAELPLWATQAATAPDRPAQLLSPSDLGGAKLLPGETDGSGEDAAKARGTALHLLLEHLPNAPRVDWPTLSATLIPDAAQRAALLPEAEAVLTAHPQIFAAEALAEVTFTATLNGQPMLGTIDRLLVQPDYVLAVDFKSNFRTPTTAADTPEGILRQMSAYAEALRQIYPSHRIDTAILWTRTATLMPLPPDIVRAAMQRSTIP